MMSQMEQDSLAATALAAISESKIVGGEKSMVEEKHQSSDRSTNAESSIRHAVQDETKEEDRLTLKRKHEDSPPTTQECSHDEHPRPEKKQQTMRSRGAHVKERPEMHETARSGQRHWSNCVQKLRKEWEEKRVAEAFPQFLDQVRMCARGHIKSQHECLLRMLQIAALERIITPTRFTHDEHQSFLGWTGFCVDAKRAVDFQQRVSLMFEPSAKPNTINNAFRRAGLVPECWGSAWHGHCPFTYRPDKRAVYSHQDKLPKDKLHETLPVPPSPSPDIDRGTGHLLLLPRNAPSLPPCSLPPCSLAEAGGSLWQLASATLHALGATQHNTSSSFSTPAGAPLGAAMELRWPPAPAPHPELRPHPRPLCGAAAESLEAGARTEAAAELSARHRSPPPPSSNAAASSSPPLLPPLVPAMEDGGRSVMVKPQEQYLVPPSLVAALPLHLLPGGG